MIGVVIPAHQEASRIVATITAVQAAARHPALRAESVRILVVADTCDDATAALAAAVGADTIERRYRNVGRARRTGAQWLLDHGARWLACTDADTTVAPDWLAAQLALDCAAVCGCVQVRDWHVHGPRAAALARAFALRYHHADGHRHIHGANMGIAAAAYRRAGGFLPMASSEDVSLVHALQASGTDVVYSAAPRVWTSARLDHRAPTGFGDALNKLSSTLD